jgi:glycerophosphoryl diester phosphodiesterase
MDLDVVTYLATHRAKLADARAVHLHPSQLTEDVVRNIRKQGIEVHSWDVNDEEALGIISTLNIPKFSTDKLQQAVDFCNKISM